MAQLTETFDPTAHDVMRDMTVIPKGDYNATITASVMKQTKNKKGKYLSLEFTLFGGQYDKRKVWVNLNLVNANPVAVEIAQSELTSICLALNHKAKLTESSVLHNRPLIITLKISPAANGYSESNSIAGYSQSNTTSTTSDAPNSTGEDEDIPDWVNEE